MSLTITSIKDHRYVEVNEAFERMTGWLRDEVIGRTPFDIGLWVNPAKGWSCRSSFSWKAASVG